jgi:DUF1680 family protein
MKISFVIGLLIVLKQTVSAGDTTSVSPAHPAKIQLFSLSDVRLLPGEFKHIQDLDHQYLLSLEPDRMASWFRKEAGLTPKAPPYPYWESENVWGKGPLAGHIMGFYLSSMSMMYAATGDDAIIQKLNYTLNQLDECQKAGGDGYLLAVPNGRKIFKDVVAGNFTTSNPLINDSWEPVYIMNKVMLGLHGVYTRCHLPLAKEILVKMADWFGDSIMNKLSHDDMQKLLVCEHGSINESYITVYELTGNDRYLEWAQRLNDEDMWVPASQGKDILDGWHANTQIPKFTGFENVYDYTGDKKLTNAAQFFWKTVIANHTWAIGGNSTGEHFFPKSEFAHRVTLIGGPESCNSVNMLRLTEVLYKDYGEMEKVDYYERTLYNHILSIYEPEKGMCAYFTSMRPGHYKVYGTPYNSFWCCTGTGFESPAKFGQIIYAHDDNSLFVNLFIPSVVEWKDKTVKLTQNTRFPDQDKTELTVSATTAQSFTLKLRHPYWAKEFVVKINGKVVKQSSRPGSYLEIKRNWKNGDKITVDMPATLIVKPLVGTDKFLYLQYGAMILATKVDNHGLQKADFTSEREMLAKKKMAMAEAPSLVGEIDAITKAIVREPTDSLKFKLTSNNNAPIELIPFNRIYLNRYAIYFPRYNSVEDANKAKQEEKKGDEKK